MKHYNKVYKIMANLFKKYKLVHTFLCITMCITPLEWSFNVFNF